MRAIRRVPVLAAAVATAATMLVLVHPVAAIAQWSAAGPGAAAAAATIMPTGGTPTLTATSSTVVVTWPAVTLGSGAPVGGYIVQRYDAITGSQATVGAGCTGVVTTTTCIEPSVPSGTWIYTDTPVQASWTGGESSPSAQVSIASGPTDGAVTAGPGPPSLTGPQPVVAPSQPSDQ